MPKSCKFVVENGCKHDFAETDDFQESCCMFGSLPQSRIVSGRGERGIPDCSKTIHNLQDSAYCPSASSAFEVQLLQIVACLSAEQVHEPYQF